MTIMAMIRATITTATNGNSLSEHSPCGTPAVRQGSRFDSNDPQHRASQMRAKILLIMPTVVGLATFSVAKDTETGLDTWLCGTAAQDPKIETAADTKAAMLTKQALMIQVGRSTREDVARLLGKPWRATNDADCEATQYGERWEYLAEDADGHFRVQVAFSKDGKASLVARIPQRGRGGAVVLAFIPDKEHLH